MRCRLLVPSAGAADFYRHLSAAGESLAFLSGVQPQNELPQGRAAEGLGYLEPPLACARMCVRMRYSFAPMFLNLHVCVLIVPAAAEGFRGRASARCIPEE